MVSTKYRGSLFALSALWIGACEREPVAFSTSFEGACVDQDGDGRGAGCAAGFDCDDTDPTLAAACGPCIVPGPGCACDDEGESAPCKLPKRATVDGDVLCTSGTMICEAGHYGACGDLETYVMPARVGSPARALILPDATPVACDDCDVDCFRVTDPLDVAPDGGGLAVAGDGGLTIALVGDAALAPITPPVLDDAPCTEGVPPDSDCDGIPDEYDALPGQPPFATSHDTIFMGLPPGSAAARDVAVNFRLNTADAYFYLDMSTDYTGAMDDAKDALVGVLRAGNYLPDSTIECGDTDGDGAPNDELKERGVLGNLACLIPDVRFGAGWFRDIPFPGPYANGIHVAARRTIPFAHELDMTSDPIAVEDTLMRWNSYERLVSNTDVWYGNAPEGSMQGLWSIATGEELYMGWARAGIPARRACPPGTWGYPCFRADAMPVVLHMTDAPMQNGPVDGASAYTGRGCLDALSTSSCNPVAYDDEVLAGMAVGTDPHYRALTRTAEDLATAEDVGEISGALVTYVLDTRSMESDIVGSAEARCPFTLPPPPEPEPEPVVPWGRYDQTASDAVFRFRVENPVDLPGQRPTLTISTLGSNYDTTLMVMRADSAFNPTTPYICVDDNIGLIAHISAEFENGNYVAIVKGYNSADEERLQITFGNRALEIETPFAAKTWSGNGGVAEALAERGVRVVSFCGSPTGDCVADNPYTAEQSRLLAQGTSALAADGSPLAFSFDPRGDGTALARDIVAAVGSLAGERALDVSVRLVESPDNPTPNFDMSVLALDTPGDACDAPIDSTSDADSDPDTHSACRPGARPRFRVRFSNPPVPNNVPPNPASPDVRPGGGYLMRLQLVGRSGSDTYVIDEVPVYIVPGTVASTPPPREYAASAVYTQTVYSNGCVANEGPRWSTLAWAGTVPAGTRLEWEMCVAEREADLATCSYTRLATVQTGGPCSTDADCENGYCDESELCQFVTGTDCEVDADCGAGARCVAGPTTDVCMWSGNPIAVTDALGLGTQGLPFASVRMTLRANYDRTLAPTVNRFQVVYVCAPLQ